MRDVNNVTGGLLRDTLAGRVADRTARTAVSEIRALHRGVKVAEEVGENKAVLDLRPTDSAVAAEEDEILATAEKIRASRERRGA